MRPSNGSWTFSETFKFNKECLRTSEGDLPELVWEGSPLLHYGKSGSLIRAGKYDAALINRNSNPGIPTRSLSGVNQYPVLWARDPLIVFIRSGIYESGILQTFQRTGDKHSAEFRLRPVRLFIVKSYRITSYAVYFGKPFRNLTIYL